jgi:hypothetical protein
MKGRNVPYSGEEMAWLEANRLLPISEYHTGFCARFQRSDVTAGHLHSLRKRKGWKTGQFAKGAAPTNKGKAMPYHPNSAATQFKPGERRGVAVDLYKPIGSERLSKNGYLERKINDDFPLQRRWRAVHLLRWEAINGPIQPGKALKCLDGDKGNTDPVNWALISRSMLPRLNGGTRRKHVAYDDAPPELKSIILAVAELEDRARMLKKARATLSSPGTEPTSEAA